MQFFIPSTASSTASVFWLPCYTSSNTGLTPHRWFVLGRFPSYIFPLCLFIQNGTICLFLAPVSPFCTSHSADQRKRGVLLLASPPWRAQVGAGVPQLLLATVTSGLLTRVLNHQS